MADPRKPFAPPGSPPEMDPASSFLDRLGIVRPRTGPAGVSRNGGVGSTGALPPLGGVAPKPAVNTAPVGRPGSGLSHSGAGVGTVVAPPPPPPAAPGGGGLDRSGTGVGTNLPGSLAVGVNPAGQPGPFIPPTSGGTPPPKDAATQPGEQAAPAAAPQQIDSQGRAFSAPRIAVPKMPSRLELEQMDPNAIVDSPYGQLVTNPETGKRELHFTPEGKQRYGAEVQRLRSRLGPNPFRNIPGAPEMEIEPGKPVFDAFSGRWVS